MIELSEYQTMLDDRPEKFEPSDVNYRDAEGKERCGRCLHYFERKIDGYGVCEIVRLPNDEPIDPGYVCDFQTQNGKHFPLRPRGR